MKKTLLVALLAAVGLTACSEAEKPQENQPSMANPASEFCVEQGGAVVIKDEESGQVGYCKLSDGRLVEEWAFMNEQDKDTADQPIGMANPSAVFCEEQGGTYINKDGENGQVGFCQLTDGTEVEAWEYFRANNEEGQAALIGMANPASVFCEEQGGESFISENADGQFGQCKLPDGTVVDSWEYYRAEHKDDTQK
ncbi:putative hemolysin [Photobacterium sanguinicancri]|uniref:DUF333 domain-containing protein n=1 Tax=Photobacterium sanguinicancri TaxID=875932 RepID=A0AAW7YAQ1_9GAMM|nr:DUF333 domain-containing protein [Photobacterium sanguinicancri]MDO6545392.1 DUF333 domain-containing protein [Photobacterium sanguinicancri]